MGEPHTGELRERLEEVLGQQLEGLLPLVEARADAAPEVVDRVVAAEQNPVVGSQSVVVELVGAVADPLSVLPSDARQSVVVERLGRERVVVDRHDVRPHSPDQRREGVGAEGDLVGSDHAGVRA